MFGENFKYFLRVTSIKNKINFIKKVKISFFFNFFFVILIYLKKNTLDLFEVQI